MLVLSRKHGESVRIHNEITVTVLQVCGNRVRLGIQAPAGVTILRCELAASGEARGPGCEARDMAHT